MLGGEEAFESLGDFFLASGRSVGDEIVGGFEAHAGVGVDQVSDVPVDGIDAVGGAFEDGDDFVGSALHGGALGAFGFGWMMNHARDSRFWSVVNFGDRIIKI